MASLCTCDEFLLLSNGRTAAIVNFSSPDVIQQLDLPAVVSATSTNQQIQATSKKSQKITKRNIKSHEETSEGQEEKAAEQAQEKRSEEDNRILSCAVSTNGQLIALCDDRKWLHVYKIEDGQCRIHFSSPLTHRSTSVRFSGNSHQVIVADKSGDAYVFDVQQQHLDYLSKSAAAGTTDHQTISGGTDTPSDGCCTLGGSLLLGHHSMLLDVLTVDSDRLVVTSDRDEKIRISHYPDGYNIQAYCLGHTQFVISLAYDERRSWLISASGDATLRVWTLTGKELCCKNLLSDIPAEKEGSSLEVGDAADVLSVGSERNRQDVPLSVGAGGDRDKSRIAIQQICYCSDCQLLFVAIYKSPAILVYRLLKTENSEDLTLQFISVLSGEGRVASMCVGRCVLWVVRQEAEHLSVAAFRLENLHDVIKLEPVSESNKPEYTVLKTISSQPDLLKAPTHLLDLIPSLWKTPFHEDLKYENNPKRHQENGSKNPSKKQKKLNSLKTVTE